MLPEPLPFQVNIPTGKCVHRCIKGATLPRQRALTIGNKCSGLSRKHCSAVKYTLQLGNRYINASMEQAYTVTQPFQRGHKRIGASGEQCPPPNIHPNGEVSTSVHQVSNNSPSNSSGNWEIGAALPLNAGKTCYSM